MSSSPAPPGGAPDTPEAWQATLVQTMLATQVMRRPEDDADAQGKDIGRLVGNDERELFVSCAPAEALQQQIDHLDPDFIAVHDIGTNSSRRLLAGIAAASKRAVQKLHIRRQGYGTTLASLEYVELPTSDGSRLLMYSTEADADTASRHELARTLLGNSRLAVIMVGELPAHALESAFKPLREGVLGGAMHWRNRHVLVLPLSGASAVANLAAEIGRGTMVDVRTTPQVTRPADAWGFINGTWARIRELLPARGAAAPLRTSAPAPAPAPTPAPAPAPTQPPLAMRPMPAVPSSAPGPAAAAGILERYVHQLAELTGMVSCCVFELSSGKPLAHAGASPGAEELANHGTELLATIAGTCRAMGLGHAIPDAAITLGAHHLLLRAVPRHPGLGLHAVLDKTHANLTLARLQVQRMDAIFDEPAA
ncbi:hypothetical protein [Piscinibacter sp.]|uniref:hypothetical protein n=1 Tax=Piscinibacter sp. TaxID=1903157 RepID=UPI0039E39DB5